MIKTEPDASVLERRLLDAINSIVRIGPRFWNVDTQRDGKNRLRANINIARGDRPIKNCWAKEDGSCSFAFSNYSEQWLCGMFEWHHSKSRERGAIVHRVEINHGEEPVSVVVAHRKSACLIVSVGDALRYMDEGARR